jgi:hypothetical protein
MSNTTGGGESVSPVVAYTASIAGGSIGLGQASATFTSGSLSSSATGVKVRATVQGAPLLATNTAPSSPDAAIVVGGTAGSIAIGMATQIVVLNTTTYQLPMSILVADSNGSPVANTVVNLSAWPIAWSTGTMAYCLADADDGVSKGTFYNEDKNENLILESGEDGYRRYFYTLPTTTTLASGTPTLDGLITPINSAGGTIPASVTTDVNGLANFNLTYLKTSAIWTVDRIKATTMVQGTEAVSQLVFSLPPAVTDVGTSSTTCHLSPPYNF